MVLTGPRQSGKTTLFQQLFGKHCGYVSLEPPDVRASANEDPRTFLETHSPPVIFDEVKHAPDLLPYIKETIDANRDKFGQYFITGSQNLLMMERITESLAGRASMLRLLPLSQREVEGHSETYLPWQKVSAPDRKPEYAFSELWKEFIRGFYPELSAYPKRDSNLWHASYVQTYLERDVRMLRQVGDLSQFQSYMRALAARSAQLLNLADLSRDLGGELWPARKSILSWTPVVNSYLSK